MATTAVAPVSLAQSHPSVVVECPRCHKLLSWPYNPDAKVGPATDPPEFGRAGA
jgi:hypothetical protein